jgi:hypothetical protein
MARPACLVSLHSSWGNEGDLTCRNDESSVQYSTCAVLSCTLYFRYYLFSTPVRSPGQYGVFRMLSVGRILLNLQSSVQDFELLRSTVLYMVLSSLLSSGLVSLLPTCSMSNVLNSVYKSSACVFSVFRRSPGALMLVDPLPDFTPPRNSNSTTRGKGGGWHGQRG